MTVETEDTEVGEEMIEKAVRPIARYVTKESLEFIRTHPIWMCNNGDERLLEIMNQGVSEEEILGVARRLRSEIEEKKLRITGRDLEELERSLAISAGDIKEVSDEDKKIIAERGYSVKRELGENEGATRRAYDAVRRVGNLELEGVLKVPKREEDITSINALINRGKRNIDLQEAIISGKLRHPGIARILDSFQLSDGRTINYEDKIEGWSLRSFLRRANFKETEKLRQAFIPVITASAYVHRQGILHRDITPNNIIIPEKAEGGVLTDWQNAAYERDIEDLAIPTRGGTAYTHPILLNALLTGNLARATRRMDVYSLGAVLYEAITGERAFNYNITEDEKGKTIEINGRKFHLGLRDGNEDLETITTERHEDNLRRAIKKVPKNLRKLIYGMLTTDRKKEIEYMDQVQTEFLKATSPAKDKFWEKTWKYLKIGGIITAIATGIGFGLSCEKYLKSLPPSPREPTLSDIMRSQSRARAFARGNIDEINSLHPGGSARDDFEKYLSEAEKRRAEIEGGFDKELEYANRAMEMDKKLTSALMRSILLEKKRSEIAGENRNDYSLVPIEFVRASLGNSFNEKHDLDEFRSKMWMGRYIQGCFQFGDNVEDVYAKALCNQQEIDMAKAEALHSNMMKNLRDRGLTVGFGGGMLNIGDVASAYNVTNIDYFAREGKEKRKFWRKETEETIYIPGYAEHLNPVKRRIIDRAVALYNITDGEGKLDFSRYRAPIKTEKYGLIIATNQTPEQAFDKEVNVLYGANGKN